MAEQNDKNKKQLSIELTEEIADGIYSNLAIISHSNSEFVMDFIRIMPGMPKAKVKTRVLMAPQHAKMLAKALIDNIKKYEQQNGNVKEIDPSGIPPLTFGGPPAQA